jgi:ABC-type uncharacterized transport system permease subunit
MCCRCRPTFSVRSRCASPARWPARCGSCWPAGCGSIAASTRPSAACCWPTSPSVSSSIWSRALRDPASLNKPATRSLAEGLAIGGIGGSDVHWGLVIGIVACLASGLWLRATASGFAVRVVGGNPRTAQLVGLPASRLILAACGLGGACAGVAGAVEVAAVHTNANASLIAGYGYAGILVSFIARHNPVAVIPVAILFGGFGAAGSLLQRRLGLPDASVLVLQGLAFVLILASEGLRMVDWKTLIRNRMPQAVEPPLRKEPV